MERPAASLFTWRLFLVAMSCLFSCVCRRLPAPETGAGGVPCVVCGAVTDAPLRSERGSGRGAEGPTAGRLRLVALALGPGRPGVGLAGAERPGRPALAGGLAVGP